MSVVIELTPLQLALWLLTGRGDQILWTEADVQEHYRQKRLNMVKEFNQKTTQPVSKEIVYQTKFTDSVLLREALKQAKIPFRENNNKFYFEIPNNQIEMHKTSSEIYNLKITGDCNKEIIQKFYEKIGKKYEQAVQKQICDNIKAQVSRSYNMNLEREECLADNSVVLTINV